MTPTPAEFRRLFRPIRSRHGDGEMAVLEFGPVDRPVDLIFVHANGFNARTYASLLAPLTGRRVWAPDLRGHGLSRLPAEPVGRRGWIDHRDDLIALLDGMDGPPALLAGHSMGATAGLLAAAGRPDRVAGLLLMDPVIWSRAAVAALHLPLIDRLPGRIPLVRNALRRRAVFPDRETALKAYRGRGAFAGWSDAMLRDYLADGLEPAVEGLVLTCAPQWEASNYAAQSHDPWRALALYPGPVEILKAQTGSACRLVRPPRDGVVLTIVPDGDHLFPMRRPEVARDALRRALGLT